MSRRYYTLIASLPPLPRIERGERLPINRERLEERLLMLTPEDTEIVHRAWDFLIWHRQPIERTDAEMVRFYGELTRQASHLVLAEMIEFRMSERTLLVALRRRFRGLGPPEPGIPWGVGPWVRHIERHWDALDFKLGTVFPWIDDARRLLEAEDSKELQRLLMTVVWNHLVRLGEKDAFSFDALLAYVFRWDILNRWLSYNAEAARQRFENLLTEVTRGHHLVFES